MSSKPSKAGKDADAPMGASPARISNPELRMEFAKALIWVGIVGLALLAVYISQSLLVIFGAMVFAAMVDGGARLLGRVLPIPRGFRIAIILLSLVGFLGWLSLFAGTQISRQVAEFPAIVSEQFFIFIEWLREQGFAINQDNAETIIDQVMSGAGLITSAIGGVFGALTTLLIILIIGIYVAAEPRLYERGVAWMIVKEYRAQFHNTVVRMGYTMRRLMFGRLVGMVFEGVFTYAMLVGYGLVTGDEIPMAALLAILTGLLAFVPNIGALISGTLMVLVGFSGGAEMGLYTIFVYFLVQNIDGYFVIPMIARKTVDLAPALVLGFQLIMGIMFGILGLFLADPLLAMIKVALEQRAAANDAQDEAKRQSQIPYMENNPA